MNQDSRLLFIILPENTVILVICGIIEESDPLFVLAASLNIAWRKIKQLIEADATNQGLLIIYKCLEQDADFALQVDGHLNC